MEIVSTNNVMEMEKKYLNKKGLSEYLGVSVGKIERLMGSGLTYVKIGRNVRFDIDDVNEFMNKNKK